MDISQKAHSLWRSTSGEFIAKPPVIEDTRFDLIVVGGGFTGCSAALDARKLGLSVCLLEANEIGFGGSGRNVGLVNAGLWLSPEDIEKELGKVAGERLSSLLSNAPELVFSLIKEHDIECEAVRNGTLHLAHSPSGFESLQNRYKQLLKRGNPVSLCSREETIAKTGLSSFHGALFDPRAGTINPLSYCRGLAKSAQDSGATIMERAPVDVIMRVEDRWHVASNGQRITSDAILIATNAYHHAIEGYKAPHFVPVHYFQLATAPLTDNLQKSILPGRQGCWDTATIMSSLRLDKSGRLIFGSIGSLDAYSAGIHKSWARRKLKKLVPQLGDFSFDYEWHGRIAMTNDHIPKILSLGENAFAVFGYSGRGIGPGTLFGKAIAQAIATQDYSALPLEPIKTHKERFVLGRQLLYETGSAAAHLADGWT